MSVLFKRGGDGNAVIYEGGGKVAARVKVPRDRSLLSVLSTNAVSDGEVFSDDGYVYDRSGRRLRKMWSYRNGWNHYWAPVVVDVARIEAVYHRLQQRIDGSYSLRLDALHQAIRDRKKSVRRYNERVWIAHVKPRYSTSSPGYEAKWWQYNIEASPYTPGKWAQTLDWIDAPKKPVNVDLGEQLYQLDHVYGRTLLRRSSLMADLLDDAIKKYIRRTFEPPAVRFEVVHFHLTINGRTYWYQRQGEKIEKLAWPGDNLHRATINRSR
jgi:hypothetical protein